MWEFLTFRISQRNISFRDLFFTPYFYKTALLDIAIIPYPGIVEHSRGRNPS